MSLLSYSLWFLVIFTVGTGSTKGCLCGGCLVSGILAGICQGGEGDVQGIVGAQQGSFRKIAT